MATHKEMAQGYRIAEEQALRDAQSHGLTGNWKAHSASLAEAEKHRAAAIKHENAHVDSARAAGQSYREHAGHPTNVVPHPAHAQDGKAGAHPQVQHAAMSQGSGHAGAPNVHEQVRNAERMYGTGSKQHLAAQAKAAKASKKGAPGKPERAEHPLARAQHMSLHASLQAQEKALQRGVRGGSFYINEHGQKVYGKK